MAHPFLAERVDEVVQAGRVPRQAQAEDEVGQEAVLREDHQVREVRARRLHYADLPVRHQDQPISSRWKSSTALRDWSATELHNCILLYYTRTVGERYFLVI